MLLNPKPNTQKKILNTPPVVELQDKSNTKTGDVVYTNSNDPPYHLYRRDFRSRKPRTRHNIQQLMILMILVIALPKLVTNTVKAMTMKD